MLYKRYLLILLVTLVGCQSRFDESLITEVYKLPSTSGKYTLLRYHFESEMAFGSGFTVLNIVKSDMEPDYGEPDVLRIPSAYPFYVKWKDDKTLFIKCTLSGVGRSKKQPIRKEVISWKDWTINVEYYGIYSSGRGLEFSFSECSLNGKWITFKSGGDSLKFNRDNVQLAIIDRKVFVDEFHVEAYKDSLGLSFTSHELTALGGFNLSKLKSEQPFLMSN